MPLALKASGFEICLCPYSTAVGEHEVLVSHVALYRQKKMVLLLAVTDLALKASDFGICHIFVTPTALPMGVGEPEICTAHVWNMQVNARYINDERNVFANILTNRLFVAVLGSELLLQVSARWLSVPPTAQSHALIKRELLSPS